MKHLIIFIILNASLFGQDSKDWHFFWLPNDTIPNSFNFTDQTNLALSTEYTSDSIVISGIDGNQTTIYAGGASYRKGVYGSWATAYGSVVNGDTIWLKNTSSPSYSTAINTTLTIGGVNNVWTLTTNSADAPTSLAAIGAVDKITLTWVDNLVGGTKTYIYRDTTTSPTTLIDSVNYGVLTYKDTSSVTHQLSPDTLYYYRIRTGDATWHYSAYTSTASDTALPILYAVDLDGSTENALLSKQRGLVITEYEYLRHNNGYLSSSADSVKGHWIFDNTINTDATQDQSARNNDLTITGDSIFASGSPVRTGNSMTFNDDIYLSIPKASATDFDFGTNSFSIETWIKTSSTELQYIVSKHTATNNYFIAIENGNAYFKATTSGTAKEAYSMDIISDGKWHYVVATCNPSASINLYVDGELEQTVAASGLNIAPDDDFCIGTIETDNTGTRFLGQIAEVRISKRLLTATEIKNNYYRFNEIGFHGAWANNGTHAIDTTTIAANYGTYGGKIIGAGIGDTTSNYVAFPVKQDLVIGDKYLIQLYGKCLFDDGEIINCVLGDKSFALDPTTSFTRGYLHFQATANTIGDSIKIYLGKADTVIIDDISIKKKFDLAVFIWFKTTVGAFKTMLRTDGSSNEGYYCYTETSNRLRMDIKDVGGAVTTITKSSAVYNDTTWHLVAYTLNWTGNGSVFYDATAAGTGSLAAVANSRYIAAAQRFTLGTFSGATAAFNGQIGEVQMVRFPDIATLNYTPAQIYYRGKAGYNFYSSYTSGTIVGWWKWSGNTNALMLDDASSSANDLTGTNLTTADQVILNNGYRP